MKLCFTCTKCKEENSFYVKGASDRAKLANQLGESFEKVCVYCSSSNTVHVNRVYAEKNRWIVLSMLAVGLLSSVGITIYIFTTYWRDDLGRDLYTLEAWGVGFAIPLILMFTALSVYSKRIREFNSYRV